MLVTGAYGMLGRDVSAVMSKAGIELTLASRSDLDITSLQRCRALVDGHDFVVNTAAWTGVDDAETHEADAFVVNAVGAANLARACTEAGARLAQISTDYVFDGHATTPYAEDAPMAPRTAYGRTKAAGEWAVRALCPAAWVVRTAWLYGEHGGNFVKTMARLAHDHETVSVVDDQHGQPTWTHDVAWAIRRLVEADAPAGTYHATAAGRTTWFGFAQEVFTLLGLDPQRVKPTTTDAYPRPAARPAWSVLGHEEWRYQGITAPPEWETSLRRSIDIVVGSGLSDV